MGKLKLRRTIYIGIGGTGIKTILKVKENFHKSCNGNTPSMIKFLCIDTNLSDLNGKDVDIVKLENTEKLHLTINQPAGAYKAGLRNGKYAWMPEENQDNIADIRGTGAGQVRSNGRFILEYNEENSKCISGQLKKVYRDLTAAVAGDDSFDIMETAKTDVYLAFSIAGGTGSGMFLRIASLIRQNIPNSNLIAYAYSPAFFEGVGVTWNIKHNAYGALLELDYNMHGNRSEYKNKSMGITDKLFDAVMYIDNKTYTVDQQQQDFTYKFDEVVENVGNALYLSAGQIGADTASIIDNLRNAMNSGGYDHECKDGMKNGWVASVGVSELFCKDNADIDYKTNQSAINVLSNLLNGDEPGFNVKNLNAWIDDLDINESLGKDDNDKLINRILDPVYYISPVSETIINIDDWGKISGDTDFKERNNRKINQSWVDSELIVSEKETEFITKLRNTLFPHGSKTIGITNLIHIIKVLKNDIKASKDKLGDEISELETKAENKKREQNTNIEIIKTEKKSKLPANASKVTSAKNTIRAIISELFKNECEIRRRREAIKMYDSLLKRIDAYVGDQDGYGYLYSLKQHTEAGISKLENEALGNYKTSDSHSEAKSTSVDLTSLVNSLPTAKAEEHPIQDWAEFFDKTGYTSISDLSNKKDWEAYAQKVFKEKFSEQSAPIIYRVLDTMQTEERVRNFTTLINRARPLLDISTFGETIKRDKFIFVSVPFDIPEEKLEMFKTEFIQAFGQTDGIEFIQHRDRNKILVYSQLGVIPPYFISGISYSKNDIQDTNSCEYEYMSFVDSNIHHSYTPFTDKFYKCAYETEGHSLDNVHKPQVIFTPIQMWVDCFIFGLIERKGDLYRIQYNRGVRDLTTRPIQSWKNLGTDRLSAYKALEESETNDVAFMSDLSNRLRRILADKRNQVIRSQYYGEDDNKANLYIDKTLMDLDSSEFQQQEIQDLLNEELDYLREN